MYGAHSIIFLKNYPQGVIHQKNMYIINTLNNKVLFKYKKNHIFFFVIPW